MYRTNRMVSEMEAFVNQENALGRPLTQKEQDAIGTQYENDNPDIPDDLRYYTNGDQYSDGTSTLRDQFNSDGTSILGEHKFAIIGILGAVLAFGLISKI